MILQKGSDSSPDGSEAPAPEVCTQPAKFYIVLHQWDDRRQGFEVEAVSRAEAYEKAERHRDCTGDTMVEIHEREGYCLHCQDGGCEERD